MLLKTEWTERFLQARAKAQSASRRSLAVGQSAYSAIPRGGTGW